MNIVTVLETDRLRLTTWAREHLDDVISLHADPGVMRFISPDGAPEDLRQAQTRMAEWAGEYARFGLGKFRVTRRSDDMFVGRAGFGVLDDTLEPEISYTLMRSHWGQGYALELAVALRDWIFTHKDYGHFIGFADANNAASLHILEKIGMTPTHNANWPHGHLHRFYRLNRKDWHVG